MDSRDRLYGRFKNRRPYILLMSESMKIQSFTQNKNNKRNVLIAVIGMILIFSDQVWSDELTIAFGQDKPPFVIGKTKTGLEIDIFREALEYKGHSMKVLHLPNRRLQRALIVEEEIDGVATVRQVPGDGLYYVEEFIHFHNYAITKTRDGLEINKVADLIGLSIVAWQNAYRDLGPEFESAFQPYPPEEYKNLYRELHSQESQNLMFWKNRAKVIVIDKTIFGWYRKQLGKEYDTTPKVTYHSIFSGKTYFQAAFKSEKLAKEFDEGLKHIKNTGRYNQLYNKYIKQ